MSKNIIKAGAALAMTLLKQVSADQPVNCLRQQFEETVWNFHVTQDSAVVNLFEQRELCTHNIPNRVQVLAHDQPFKFAREDIWQIKIRPDYSAEGSFCKNGDLKKCDDAKVSGWWQTYYDQAILVELENDLRFVSNFKYSLKTNVTADPQHYSYKKLAKLIPDTDTASKAQFDSICNATMVGFMFNKKDKGTLQEHPVTCFYAAKDPNQGQWLKEADKKKLMAMHQKKAAPHEEKVELDSFELLQTSQQVQAEASASIGITQRKKKHNMFASHEPNSETDSRILEINSNQDKYTWQANPCMLSQDHPEFSLAQCELDDEDEEEETASPVQSLMQNATAAVAKPTNVTIAHNVTKALNVTSVNATKTNGTQGLNTHVATKKVKKVKKKRTNLRKNDASGKGKFGDMQDPLFKHAMHHVQTWSKKYSAADEIPDSEIPEEYDFRNIKGYDFTGKLRDQGTCGSCYTMGFIQTIEARLKVKYGHLGEQPEISPQFLMQCNYMNEGCDGGWAIFHGFLAEKGHLVREDCAPYKESTKASSCAAYAKCPGYAKVDKSYYVNGYNSEPTVQQIQKDMLMHGPLTTEFKCDRDFQLYRSGIMIQTHKAPENWPGDPRVKEPKVQPAANKTGSGILAVDEDADEAYGKIVPFEDERQKKFMKEKKLSSMTQTTSQSQAKSEAFVATKMANQPLDHTIFLVGWGYDKKHDLPYWIVRNSYGDKWGMRGDFFVRRGHDDYGIESELSGYQVSLLGQEDREEDE